MAARPHSSLSRIGSVLVALFLLLVGASVAKADESFQQGPLTIVTAKGIRHAFTVELALTPRQRSQGLMNRREMGADRGMLFDFGETRQVLMWMKNTYLPLDMLFIDGKGTIRTIRENAEPLSEAIIDSRVPVAYVLELNGGTVRKLGIRTGDTVESPVIRKVGETP